MKRLEEYTQAELANLSEQEIQDVIDIECAYEGVRLLPPHPTEYVAKVFEPDTSIYEVGGFKFVNQDDALKVTELLKTTKLISYTYDYNVGYDYNYIKDEVVDVPNISTKKVFSKEKYLEMKADMLNVKKEKDNYSSQMSLYNEIVKERKSVVDSVYEAINDAVDKETEKKRIIDQYNRYLTLADNNTTTAKTFLADALHLTIEEVNDLELS